MAIQNVPDSQKIDYLWKKIGYGAAKTDISGNNDATQEPFASPLQIRADKIMQQSALIPSIIPGSNSSVVTVYPTNFPVECTNDAGIPTPTLTWNSGRTFWVPPEFGSTYQIKVYIAPSGNAANVTSKGTQVFATGSGNNDEWFFDYQSGILQFNGNNTPYSGGSPISFTGNSVYISGAVYSGAFGLPSVANIGSSILGNITFSNVTISTSITNSNIYLSPSGSGVVQVTGNLALGIPYGSSAQRPLTTLIGYTRFNTDVGEIESWNGTGWVTPGTSVITSDIINPDGYSNVYTLTSNASTTGVMVSINGTLQQPYTAYNIVSNNTIVFTEVPLTTDTIEVRHLAQSAVSISTLSLANSSVILDGTNVNIQGNLVPSLNNTYNLGSTSNAWHDIVTAGHSVYANSNISIISGNTSIIDSYDKTIYRTGKYIIQSTTVNSTYYESYEAIVIHDSLANAFVSVYGVINTGNVLGNLSAIVSGNIVQLRYTAFTNNVYVKSASQLLTL